MNDSDKLRLDDSFYKDDFSNGLDANLNIDRERPDFYVGPLGPEQTLPATGYRYSRYLNDDGSVNKWAQLTIDTGETRLSYFGFTKLDTAAEVINLYQVRGPQFVTPLDPEPAWSDSRLQLPFDTLQLYENGELRVKVPYSHGGKGTELEPFTSAYPQYGTGGLQQLIPSQDITIKVDSVDILPEK